MWTQLHKRAPGLNTSEVQCKDSSRIQPTHWNWHTSLPRVISISAIQWSDMWIQHMKMPAEAKIHALRMLRVLWQWLVLDRQTAPGALAALNTPHTGMRALLMATRAWCMCLQQVLRHHTHR